MTRTAILLVLVATLLITQGQPRVQADGSGGKQEAFSRLGTDLRVLYEEHEASLASPQLLIARQQSAPGPSAPSNPLLRVANGKVEIDVLASGDVDGLRSDLEALGMENVSSYGRVISGQMPISSLGSLADLDGVRFARPSYYLTRAGLTTSQGDAAMGSDIVRNNLDLTGASVTIGVLSDSYNCQGGASADIDNDDLPPATSIEILQDLGPDPNNNCWSDEGRAMMQIIHDVAPGANLAFHTAVGPGQATFANGILALRDAGADIIVDDVQYLAEPMFQDGIIAQAVDAVVSTGVAYFSAAGNDARQSYESQFTSGAGFNQGQIPGFQFRGGTAHDFSGGGDYFQKITIPQGKSILASFQWDSPFFSASGVGSPNDLDIYLLNSDNSEVLTGGINPNTGKIDPNLGNDPVEILSYLNPPNSGETEFNIMIAKESGPDPGRIKYVFFSPSVTINEYDTASGTIFGHPNAAGAVAVGAAPYYDTTALEPFSSAGPTPILLDISGNPIPEEIRLKPEIVAPDDVNTTFFGVDTDADGSPNFAGTSAAAPHAAAVAALMLELNPSLSPADIYQAMESTALDMKAPGFDFDSGHGFIDAYQAIQASTSMIFAVNSQANMVSTTTSVAIVLTNASDGLKRFDLQVTLNSPKIAQIGGVQYMSGLNSTTTPASLFHVSLSGNDAKDLINSSSTSVTLATLEVQALSKGTTSIDITLGLDGLIDDSDGNITTLQLRPGTLTVANIAPVVDTGSGGTIDQGNTFSGSGSFTDPDDTDTSWNVTVDYGNGGPPQVIAATSTSFSLSNSYPSPGDHTITVTVDDGDGGVTSDSIAVKVLNVIPTLPGQSLPARDLDGDGLAEDINGKNQEDFTDVIVLFQNLRSQEVLNNIEDFDFNGSGGIDFDDVVALFRSFQD